MQPYQEEYLANLREIAALTERKKAEGLSFDEYARQLLENEALVEQKVLRNMELLRAELFPLLDDLPEAEDSQLVQLFDFASSLLNTKEDLDAGLFCQIHQALLTRARQKRNRREMIRELYWLGIGRNSIYSRAVGMELTDIEKYLIEMRLCFTEGAAYLKYFDELEDTETRGYILRCRANMALGQFRYPGERVQLIRETLQILNDKEYQQKAPDLPWERFIYMTHQQMAASISYTKERNMSAEDMASIMDSVYIVYQRRILETEERQEPTPMRWSFPYYAIEYYCGITTLDFLMTRMEALMDSVQPTDFSADGMYGMISVSAFYCQYLQQYPELIPARKEYVEALYRRIRNYTEAFSKTAVSETIFRYLRQLSHTFVETEDSIPYGEFIHWLLFRFAPEIYIHSWIVGEGAKAFCAMIFEEDPTFFDDIPFIREISNQDQKKNAVLTFALECGLFHDVGKINFIDLYTRNARQWFEEEYEMGRLHTVAGEGLLASRPSTSRYTAAALGHHTWYDGSHGYPEQYKRLESPYRQMVDIISLVDWLENVTHSAQVYTGIKKTMAEAVEEAVTLEGKRFSPLLTAWLREEKAAEWINDAFAHGRFRAYRQMYNNSHS